MYLFIVTFLIAYKKKPHILIIIIIMDVITAFYLFIYSIVWYIILITFIIMFYINSIY